MCPRTRGARRSPIEGPRDRASEDWQAGSGVSFLACVLIGEDPCMEGFISFTFSPSGGKVVLGAVGFVSLTGLYFHEVSSIDGHLLPRM